MTDDRLTTLANNFVTTCRTLQETETYGELLEEFKNTDKTFVEVETPTGNVRVELYQAHVEAILLIDCKEKVEEVEVAKILINRIKKRKRYS